MIFSGWILISSYRDTRGWHWHILHAALLIPRVMGDFQLFCYNSVHLYLSPNQVSDALTVLCWLTNTRCLTLDTTDNWYRGERTTELRGTSAKRRGLKTRRASQWRGKEMRQSRGRGDCPASNPLDVRDQKKQIPLSHSTFLCMHRGFRVKFKVPCLWP